MLDNYQFRKDVFKLVDSKPLNYVEIGEIIQKNITDNDYHAESTVRTEMCTQLENMKREGEIDFNASNRAFLQLRDQNGWAASTLQVKSTPNRQNRIEEKQSRDIEALNQNKAHIEVHGNNIGTIQATGGNIDNQSLNTHLSNPNIHTNNPIIHTPPNKRSKIEILYWLAGIGVFLLTLYQILKKH